MAKNVTISESKWEDKWKSMLDRLELDKLRIEQTGPRTLEELHRRFHYEMVSLKQDLEND